MNIATHCNECSKPLGPDRYNVSPTGGGICKNIAWCSTCYENLHKTCSRHRLEPVTSRQPYDEEDDNEDY
jgi:hypothetical protein